MGEGAHTNPDKWQRKIEQHSSCEADFISCGPPQDCGCAKSQMGAGQSITEEGTVNRITPKRALFRDAGFVRLRDTVDLGYGHLRAGFS